MGKGGGGSQTVTQTNIPSYAKPYFIKLMQRSYRFIDPDWPKYSKYKAYKGKRVADLNIATVEGLDDVIDMRRDGPVNATMDYAIDREKETFAKINSVIEFDPANIAGNRNFTYARAQDYMPGFEKAVADTEKARLRKEFQKSRAARAAEAVAAGALGGTRYAVAEQMAAEEMNVRMAEIEAKSARDSYVFAENTFSKDVGRQLEIEKQNVANDIQARQIKVSAISAKAQMGAGLFEQGVKVQEVRMKVADAAIKAGQIKQSQRQQVLEQRYTDFVNQRDWVKSNLTFYAATLKSVPVAVNSDVRSSDGGGSGLATALAGVSTIMDQSGKKGP